MFLRTHVDEVDDDQAAEVADTQLPGDLVRCLQVRIQGGRLDIAALGGARRVNVDRNERFGVIDHDTAA